MVSDLAIIIVSYNVADLLAACLRSVFATTSGLRYEVIVVDNASSDNTAEMMAGEFPQVSFIANDRNVGFAAANNQAIRQNHSPFVLLLNPDTEVRGNALQALCTAMRDHPDIGVLGPRIVNPDGSLQSAARRFPSWYSILTGRHDFPPTEIHPGIHQADWVLGAALLVRRQVIDQVGLLDENYFLYAEERDWCYRIKQAGWEVGVLMDAEIVHYGGQSTAQCAPKSYENLIHSQVRFLNKHCSPGLKSLYLLTTFANAGSRELVARSLALSPGNGSQWRERTATYAAGRRLAWSCLFGGERGA